MTERWQHQIRLYFSDELADVARQDPGHPALAPLAGILAKHNASLMCQFDAFAGYVAEAEARGVESYPLYRWTKATIEDPEKRAKHIRSFALHVKGREVYPKEEADALEADLKPLVDGRSITRLSRHDTNQTRSRRNATAGVRCEPRQIGSQSIADGTCLSQTIRSGRVHSRREGMTHYSTGRLARDLSSVHIVMDLTTITGHLDHSTRRPIRHRAVLVLEAPVSVSQNQTARPSPFSPLRHGTFRAVWMAILVSNFGGLIQSVGAAWLMTSLTGSVALVALVQASTTLPIMLFSLTAGAIADNYEKRGVMLAAQSFLVAVSVALAGCAYFGLITPWSLLGFTFLIGCGTALNNPAWHSSVRDMVPRQDLPQAIALNSVGMNIARSVGPALGGTIVATAGAAAAFAVNAFSYFALIAVLFRWKPEREVRPLPPEPLGSAMSAGIRFVAMSPTIRTVLFRAFMFGLAGSAVQALMPLVARDLIGGGPVTFGLLLGAFGLGAITGGLFSSRIRQARGTEGLVRLSFTGFAACALVSAVSSITALTMFAMALGGACWVLALSSFNVAVQVSSPRWVVGRTLALYQAAAFGGIALGSWTWGLVAERFSISQALALSAFVHLIAVLVGLRWMLPQDDEANLEPLNRWSEPSLSLEIQPRSGPIVVTIEYRIREEDVREFLTLMAERRRIRRRDGARHWHLLRDLSAPELWTERYDTPTWLDYVRMAQRITHADARIVDRLRELHRGPEPPQVRRRIERQPVSTSLEAGHSNGTHYYATDPTQSPS